MYFVSQGTPGFVSKGTGRWQPFKATKDLCFKEAVPHKTSYLVFVSGPWEFMVLTAHTNGGFAKMEDERRRIKEAFAREPYGTFNRSILGRNGRGANRRRNQKR